MLQLRYAELQETCGKLAFQLSALKWNDDDINEQLIEALKMGHDVRPILDEARENLLQAEQTCHDSAANMTELAALHRQSAEAMQKLIS